MLFFSPLRLRKEMMNLMFLVLAFLFLQVYFLVDLIGVHPILSLFWSTGELHFPYSLQVMYDLMTGFSCTTWAEMTCITYRWLYLIARSPVSHPFAPCLVEHGHLCDLWMWRSIMPVWIWNAMPAQGGAALKSPARLWWMACEWDMDSSSVKSWDSGLIYCHRLSCLLLSPSQTIGISPPW